MSSTNPVAPTFVPRHRPPPIQVESEQQQQQQKNQGVSFSASPGFQKRNNGRSQDGYQRPPRTPFPPGVNGTGPAVGAKPGNQSYRHYSPQRQQQFDGLSPTAAVYTGPGTPVAYMNEATTDPQVYAALHAKQQELLATSMYIAQQQQKIQVAMYQNAQQQQQQQQQQHQQQTYFGGHPMQYYPQTQPYMQDQDGNYWYVPAATHTPDVMQYSATASPARMGSPASFYGVGSSGAESPGSNKQQQQQGKKKGHRKTASLSGDKRTPSPAPYNVAFDEYKVVAGSKASPAVGGGSGANVAEKLPTRQPMIPITIEELKKPVHADLNFWKVGVSRLATKDEGRKERGKVLVELPEVEYKDVREAWGLPASGSEAVEATVEAT